MFGRSEETRIADYIVFPVELDPRERNVEKLANPMSHTGGDDEVFWLRLSQHTMHRINVFACKSPVAFSIQVP